MVYHPRIQQQHPSGGNPRGKGNARYNNTVHLFPLVLLNTGWGKYTHSYTQYTGSNYKQGSGAWQYKTTKEPLAKVTPIDGHQQYSGGWWNEKVENVVTVSADVTYYRYRDRLN